MAELKKYTAVINGLETTLRLTEKEAQRRGLREAAAPINKGSRGTRGAGKQQTPPANKARAKQEPAAPPADPTAPIESGDDGTPATP